MERCPCCKARLREVVICPRCKADLNEIINSEQYAKFWLANAIDDWNNNNPEQSANALKHSIHLKKTELALTFRDFIIEQQCQNIQQQLEEKQIISAKKQLYALRVLFPYSQTLRELNSFADFLLIG